MPSLEDVFVSLIEARDRAQQPQKEVQTMKVMRLWAIARKEFIHILRDPRSLGMAIVIPMLLLLLFGYALTLDVDNVPIVIWDQSETHASREFISQFDGSKYFHIQKYAHNYNEVQQAVDSRRALAAIVIPRDFAALLDSGREATVQFIVDGSDSNTATIAISYAETATLGYSQNVALNKLQHIEGKRLYQPVDMRARVWYNADMESKNYIISGSYRGDHDGNRSVADFFDGRTGVGARHHGATHQHTGQRARN